MLKAPFITKYLATIGMFRRRRGRGRKRQFMRNPVMHLPSSIGNSINAGSSVINYAAVVANYGITGTALTSDLNEQVDRSQTVRLGENIDTITWDIGLSPVDTGIIEICVFKVERANSVPTTDGTLLPANSTITTTGLQAAMRQYQPGRIIHYRKVGVAAAQPRAIKVVGNFAKFKMSKIRTGDYYGIAIYNRTPGICIIDFEARYKSGAKS